MIHCMPHIWTPTCIFQIIRECKDILAKAVLVKQYYQHMIATVLDDNELAAENSPMDLENFDGDMSKMFKVQYKADNTSGILWTLCPLRLTDRKVGLG